MALQETTRKRKQLILSYHQPLYEVPLNNTTQRPFRLYNAKSNIFIVHRYYSSQRHAEWGVLKEMKWLPMAPSST